MIRCEILGRRINGSSLNPSAPQKIPPDMQYVGTLIMTNSLITKLLIEEETPNFNILHCHARPICVQILVALSRPQVGEKAAGKFPDILL